MGCRRSVKYLCDEKEKNEKTMAILKLAIIVLALLLPISSVFGETGSPDTAIIEMPDGAIQTTILQKEPEFVPGELIVKFTPEISVKSTISPKGGAYLTFRVNIFFDKITYK